MKLKIKVKVSLDTNKKEKEKIEISEEKEENYGKNSGNSWNSDRHSNGSGVSSKKGLETEEFPVSENPVEQTKFQAMPQEIKELEMKKIINKIKECGIKKIFVYCNSLSSAVDMEKLSKEENIVIVTPMDAYKNSCGLQLSRCICS